MSKFNKSIKLEDVFELVGEQTLSYDEDWASSSLCKKSPRTGKAFLCYC